MEETVKETTDKKLGRTLLKIDQVAKILNVHKNTLRDWDNKKILKAIRFGRRRDRRYDKDEILRFQTEDEIV